MHTSTYLSNFVDGIMFFAAVWGMYSFYPFSAFRAKTASGVFCFGLSLIFATMAAHSINWLSIMDWVGIAETTSNTLTMVFTVFWAVVALIGGYLIFYARWLTIPPEEQPNWPVLMVAFYPDEDVWIYRIFAKITRK